MIYFNNMSLAKKERKMVMERKTQLNRITNETKIELSLNLDGSGKHEISTGIGFFDHMLSLVSAHGLFDINIKTDGDLHVDSHHTIEDTGIVLGAAINKALGQKEGITRYGSAIIPMDEALILCAIDLSGRPFFEFDVNLTHGKIGEMDTEMVEEFFRSVSSSAGMNLHLKLLSGKNNHHIAEGLFKAFARALDMATVKDPRVSGVPSTKGVLNT